MNRNVFKEITPGQIATYGNRWAQVGYGLVCLLVGLFFFYLISFAMRSDPDSKWMALIIPSIAMTVGGIMLVGTRRVVIDRKQGSIAVQWGLLGMTLINRTGSLQEVEQVSMRMDVSNSGSGRMRKAHASYVISLGPVDCYSSRSHQHAREQAQFLGQYLDLPVRDTAAWFGKDLCRKV